MSSNIEVTRICEYCKEEFKARTTTTRYCSRSCNTKDYKARVKAGKLKSSNTETLKQIIKPVEAIQAKEFLTVNDAAILLSSSSRTIYRLIDKGILKAVNLSERKTLIPKSNIEAIFRGVLQEPSKSEEKPTETVAKIPPVKYDMSDCYSLKEIQEKYNISEKALQKLIERNRIPKQKIGWYAYVPKIPIDDLLK